MQPDLENIKKKIQENRDLIDRIRNKLPGFTGYVEKTEFHTADKIVRNLIAEKIQGYKNDVNALSGKIVKTDDRAVLSDLESMNLSLEKLQKKCLYADSGSTAALSGVKISDDDQNRLLEYDWRLISSLDECDTIINEMKSGDGLKDLLGKLSAKINEFEKSFDERKNVLLEVI